MTYSLTDCPSTIRLTDREPHVLGVTLPLVVVVVVTCGKRSLPPSLVIVRVVVGVVLVGILWNSTAPPLDLVWRLPHVLGVTLPLVLVVLVGLVGILWNWTAT